MKKIIILILSLFSTCLAQTFYMSVSKTNGTTAIYPVSKVRYINFTGIITNVKDQNLASQLIKPFQLFQNYPNPFNPSTTIEYQIPQTGLVQIYIFNVQGRMMRRLDNSIHQAGTQRIVWDGRDNAGAQAASGVYFCQVKFLGKAITKKLMFIK